MSGNSSKRDTRTASEAETTRKCLDLRLAGATLAEIGAVVGLHKSNVSRRIKQALADIPATEASELREVENQRLERLQRAVWPQAIQGNHGAVDRVLRIAERRARLNGLDAPQRLDLGAKAVDIDGVAKDILASMRAGTGDTLGPVEPGEEADL